MRKATVLLLFMFLIAGKASAQADLLDARVERLEINNRDDTLTVSYRVSGTFTKDIIERIQSGIETAFEHRIKIYKKVPIFPVGKTLVERIILTSVRYDSLTKQYSLSKKVDDQTVETSVADTLDKVEKWMTEVNDFKMIGIEGIRGKKKYFLKVRASLAPNFLLFIIPYDYSASKEKELRF